MENEDRLFLIAEKIEATPSGSLSAAQKTFKLIWELEAEVNNGGFQQYFHNSSGRGAPDVEAALRAIGADKCADLTAKALLLLGGAEFDCTNDSLRQSRALKAVNAEAEFDELDHEFYAYPDSLSDLLGKFVIDHPEEF